MISYIRGELIDHTESTVVLDVNGIGYEIYVPYSVICSVERKQGTMELYTYLQVKEDQIALFGFTSKHDLKTFKLLITVNGIGPKAALGILSNITSDNLILAILSEDSKTLSKIPGLGAKTAGKIVLELKDKFSFTDTLHSNASSEATADTSAAAGNQNAVPQGAAKDEAVAALVALGYTVSEAVRAVNSVQNAADMDSEKLLKASLKYL